jgi:anthranilate phosphoribosyltransferase
VKPEELRGGEPALNAMALKAVLDGMPGPFRDVAVMNAAAALVVAGKAKDLADGVKLALKSVESGAAKERLKTLVAVSNAKS